MTILIPCGNVTGATPLPPACPGFDTGAYLRDAYAQNLSVVARLEPQYNAGGPNCLRGIGSDLRTLADSGSNHTSYRDVARTYARVAASLPRPPDGSPLYVHLGNELNLAWSCRDAAATHGCLDMATVAAESAYFQRDVLAALRTVPGLRLAVAPVAPMGNQARQCNPSAVCPGAQDTTLTSLAFEVLALRAVPQLWHGADWFASHAYPCAPPGCGLGGDPRPGTDGWNAPYPIAKPWLAVYRNETRLVGLPQMPVIVTETGWCMDFCTEVGREGGLTGGTLWESVVGAGLVVGTEAQR